MNYSRIAFYKKVDPDTKLHVLAEAQLIPGDVPQGQFTPTFLESLADGMFVDGLGNNVDWRTMKRGEEYLLAGHVVKFHNYDEQSQVVYLTLVELEGEH